MDRDGKAILQYDTKVKLVDVIVFGLQKVSFLLWKVYTCKVEASIPVKISNCSYTLIMLIEDYKKLDIYELLTTIDNKISSCKFINV
jgi:hypothetical protein